MTKNIAFLSLLFCLQCRNEISKSANGEQSMVESSIGLIYFKGDTKDAIDFYDHNGKKQASFYLYDLTNIKKVTPYAYNAEYRLMAFKVIPSELPDMYKVLSAVNSDVIYLKKNDGLFVSKTWEEHVMSVYTVRSTQESHFYQKASTYSSEITIANQEVATPIKIDGDWLQVEYEQGLKKHNAWIRWKKDGRIIIGLVYVS